MAKRALSGLEGKWTSAGLLRRLKSKAPGRRDEAALAFRRFVDEAREGLWEAILEPRNRLHRGTLVRTLQWVDCSDYFGELVELVLEGHYEVQCHALKVLPDQTFNVTPGEVKEAVTRAKGLKVREHLTEKDARVLKRELLRVLRGILKTRRLGAEE